MSCQVLTISTNSVFGAAAFATWLAAGMSLLKLPRGPNMTPSVTSEGNSTSGISGKASHIGRCSGGVRIPTPEMARPSSGKPSGSLAISAEIAAPIEWPIITMPGLSDRRASIARPVERHDGEAIRYSIIKQGITCNIEIAGCALHVKLLGEFSGLYREPGSKAARDIPLIVAIHGMSRAAFDH
eukprot:gene36976-49890_t